MKDAIKSIKMWFIVYAIGTVVAFIVIVFVSWNFFQYEKTQREQDDELRIERTIESCLQENISSERTREFVHEQLAEIIITFTDEDIEEFSEEFEQYDEFITMSFPYRQCSERCVLNYLTPNVGNCIPAKTPRGKEPITNE